MKNKQFVSNPTLLWPIINLIIKLLSSVVVEGAIEGIAILITNGVGALLSNNRNEELITCALTELMAVVLHLTFGRIKEDCPVEGGHYESTGAEKISPSTFVVFEGVLVLVRENLSNPAL